jgi:hypothetical protein
MRSQAVPGKPVDTFDRDAESTSLLDAVDGSEDDRPRNSSSLEGEGKKQNSSQASQSKP